MLACGGNLSELWSAPDATQFVYNFTFVPTAAMVVYGFGFGFPAVLTILMKIFGSKMEFVQVVCVYGYSFAIFIPVAFVCSYPSGFIQFIAIIYGIAISTIFLLLNFSKELNSYMPKSKYIILGLLGAVQVAIFLTFKFYFFGMVYDTTTPAPNANPAIPANSTSSSP